MEVICKECELEFIVDVETGKYKINDVDNLCCPICQCRSPVLRNIIGG